MKLVLRRNRGKNGGPFVLTLPDGTPLPGQIRTELVSDEEGVRLIVELNADADEGGVIVAGDADPPGGMES